MDDLDWNHHRGARDVIFNPPKKTRGPSARQVLGRIAARKGPHIAKHKKHGALVDYYTSPLDLASESAEAATLTDAELREITHERYF